MVPAEAGDEQRDRALVVLLLLYAFRGRHFPEVDVKQLGERRRGLFPEASSTQLGGQLLGLGPGPLRVTVPDRKALLQPCPRCSGPS